MLIAPLLMSLALPALAAVDAPVSLTSPDGEGLRMIAYDSDTVVAGPLAYTELRLTFANPEDRVVEGRFRLVLADGAAVSRFAMKIDGRWQEGEVVEKQAGTEGLALVGSAANASGTVSTTIHGDTRSPMGVASMTVADSSRLLSTLQRSSSHDAQSSL